MTRRLIFRLSVAAICAAAILVGVHFLIRGEHGSLLVSIAGREVELLAPRWLYLLGVIPYFFVIQRGSLSDLSEAQQLIGTFIRGLVVIGITTALARPATPSDENRIATVFLVDVSESIADEQLARAEEYIKEAQGHKRPADLLEVITFAARPHYLGKATKLARHAEEPGTNIQAALRLAYGLFPPGYLPRVVILGDGNQTMGDLATEAESARGLGVKISWQVFPAERVQEIRAVALYLPEEVKVGAPFELSAEIWSSHEERVTLTLRQDDFPNGLEPEKTVLVHEGVNRVPFRSEAKAAGFTTYKLALKSAKGDSSRANNETVATTAVKGRPHVLFVEGEYERLPQAAGYLAKALDREDIDVEVRGPRGVPSSSLELARYDLLLISDVPAMFLGLAQMQAIEGYVRDLGGGFIMSGGESSFGSGGYQGTRIEKLLPVRFDGEKELNQPQVAIALVIDRSGSMAGEKIEMAKESARATVEVLTPTDLISVIAFDNQPTTIVRLQRASNRLRISTDISRLQPGGGTNIFPALQEAYNVLASANAKVKHVILLSDGQAPYEGIAEICEEMRANRITVSAVGIGDADRGILSTVVERGEGRLYFTDNAAELPRIFMKETEEVQRSSLVEDAIAVHVAKEVEMIEGTGVDTAPILHGYVATKPKPQSEVILVSERQEPLLARWRVGLGQVVAWTSDVKNRWATEWLTWSGYSRFWAQVVRTSMRHKQHESYDLFAEVTDGRAHVTVDAIGQGDRFVNGLETTLEVIDPKDSRVKRSLAMEQTTPGRYEVDFAVDRYGTYVLKAVHKRDGEVVAESLGAVALPYPAEYLRSTPDEGPFRQAALITRGQERPRAAAVFAPQSEKIRYRRELWPFVLVGVAFLFIVDLYLRRVRLFGYRAMRF